MENITQGLLKNDYHITHSFITPQEVCKFAEEIDSLSNSGKFSKAGTGNNEHFSIRNEIRSDSVCWFEPLALTSLQQMLWDKLDTLKNQLNENLMMGLVSFSGHYAKYESGDKYERHIDAFQSDSKRMLSVVLYLNQNWVKSDGGSLRLYLSNKHCDISPTGGTLVCFLSKTMQHKVMVSHNTRKSFTGWFNLR